MPWPRLRGLPFFLAILIMASLYSLLSVFTSFTSREPDELEHSDTQLEEPVVAHDVEAKARRRIATTQALIDREAGAILPPEIFLILLRTIMTWDRRLEVDLEMIRTHPLDPDLRDQAVRDVAPARTLKTCALVCRYWAIRCREVMFRDRIIEIHSYRQARRFKSCLKVPNSVLEPITTYISAINVEHVYSRTIPFFELVNLPQTRGKLAGLFICGPFPDHIPASSRDTPHWNAPFPMACRITPSNTAYKDVTIRNLDFPSFKHVAKYMRHFGDAEAVRLQKITWPTTSDFPREFVECLRRPNRRSRAFVSATRCTDDLLVCLHVSMMFARFPLRREVPKDDQLWAIELFTTIRDFYYQNVPLHEDSKPTCHLDSFEQANWAFNKPPLHFWMSGFSIAYPQISVYFECAPRLPLPGRRSFGPIRIVGMTLVIHAAFRPTADTIDKTFDLTAFRSDLDCRYALSFTVIAFGDYDTMLAITQRHPTLLTTPDPRRSYVLACKRSRKHPFGELKGHKDSMPRGWVGIDPVTLTSNGMEWEQEKLILPDLVRSQ